MTERTALFDAYSPEAMTGYSIEMWRIREQLINWDTLFALGFTSYKMLVNSKEKHKEEPLDPIREILLRLYLISPEFPHLFVAPPILSLVDYLFNLGDNASDEDRKRCIAQLAPVLGRDRGAGYRWMSDAQSSGNPVSLAIRRMIAKVFSMDPATARGHFWKVTLITAHARNVDTTIIEGLLEERGVELD